MEEKSPLRVRAAQAMSHASHAGMHVMRSHSCNSLTHSQHPQLTPNSARYTFHGAPFNITTNGFPASDAL